MLTERHRVWHLLDIEFGLDRRAIVVEYWLSARTVWWGERSNYVMSPNEHNKLLGD